MVLTVNMATYYHPDRLIALRESVSSLVSQCDVLRVCLNGYDDVPDFLIHDRIETLIPQQDLGASGKFYWAEMPDQIYLTVDDDILYPNNYCELLKTRVQNSRKPVVFTSHGSILKPGACAYRRDRVVLHFEDRQLVDLAVHIGGTGVMAFSTNSLRLSSADITEKNSDDLWFAIAACARSVPIVSIRRPRGWLRSLGCRGIYHRRDEALEVERARAVRRLAKRGFAANAWYLGGRLYEAFEHPQRLSVWRGAKKLRYMLARRMSE